MKHSEFFPAPYFNGVRPKPFLKETKDFYVKKAMTYGGKKRFNKDFGRSKPKI